MDEDELPEKTTADITSAEKVQFLQFVRQGYDRQEAAGFLGYKARPWRAITSPESGYYDESFANAYLEAIGSPEAKINALEQFREEAKRRAMLDSDRLLEKFLMVHDPEWTVLRQKDVNVNISAVLQQRFKDLPTALLEQLLAAIEDRDVIEIDAAEIAELTAGGEDDGEH